MYYDHPHPIGPVRKGVTPWWEYEDYFGDEEA